MLAVRTPGAVVALALPLFLASSSLANPGDIRWMFQGIEDIVCADLIKDNDGDFYPEVIVESYDAGAGTADHLYCLSGASPGPAPTVLWSARPPGGPSNSGGYGAQCVNGTSDLNGDGIEDVLLGTAWGGRTAYGIDGKSGAVIWDFDTYSDTPPSPAASGWVYTIKSVTDVTGDGHDDVVFGVGSDNNRAYHVDGATGAVLWSINLGDAIFSSTVVPDVNGDGKVDVAVGVGDLAEAVWMLKGGATGAPVIWTVPASGTVHGLATIEDLDGDDIPDVVAALWDVDKTVVALSGADGSEIWDYRLGTYGMRVEILDDVNGDGIQDIALASWADGAFVMSGIDGTVEWSYFGSGDFWAIDRVDDLNGDGINDVAAGSFDQNVYALDGVDGSLLWSRGLGNRLYDVQGTPDLTGNGVPDVFAGTQRISGVGGRAFLLEGGDNATPVRITALVEARSGLAGVELRLRGAEDATEAWVERSPADLDDGAARASFRHEVQEAHEEGRLTTREAIEARTHDPGLVWTRLGEGTVPVRTGRATWVDATAEEGRSYRYRFALLREGTPFGYSQAVTVSRSGAIAGIRPLRVHPNPGRGPVTVEFELPSAQGWRMEAFDAAGRRVATRTGEAGAGTVQVSWDGRDGNGGALADGVYFLRVETGESVSTAKVTRLR
jgi:hypothetical protein